MAEPLSTCVELYLHADQTTFALSHTAPTYCRLAEDAIIDEKSIRIETVIDGKSRFYDETIEKQVGRMVYFELAQITLL